VVHIVLPLAVPAAFGFAILYRWGREGRADADTVSVGLVVVLAVVVVGSMAWTGYSTSFADPKSDDNPLVQYAQPSGDVEPTLAEMRTLADRNDGTDVVLYGSHFHNPTGDDELARRPTCSNWFNSLPLPWYFEAGEMAVDCAPEETDLEAALQDDPPVVIAHEMNATAVDERIGDDYDRRVFLMRTDDTPFVFYVDETRLE
jgi:predicted membrane-bound mannosyltransferase